MRERWPFVVVLLLAAALRVPGLSEELWLDEALTVSVTTRPLGEMFELLALDNKPPAYDLFMHGWLGLFGHSEVALRCSSLLFGLLTVWLLCRFGTELGGRRAGVAAAAVYAVTPLSIYYSTEGRNYAMVSFAVLLAVWSAHRATSEEGKARHWVIHGVAFAACIYVHFIAAPVALVSAALVALHGWRRHLKGWLLAMVGAGVAFAPWAAIAAQQVGDIGNSLSWAVPFWEGYPPPLAIPRSLLAFMPGGQVPPFVGLPFVDWLQPVLAVGVGAVVLLVALPKAGFLELLAQPTRVLALSFVLLPLLVPFVASFHTPVYLVGRGDFLVYPGFCLLAALAWGRLRPPIGWAGVALLVFACLASWPRYFEGRPRNGEREPLAKVARSVKPGDLVVCTDLSRPTAEYYLGASVPGVEFASFPADVANHTAFIDRESYRDRPELLAADAEAVVGQVRALPRGQTAWVLFVDHPLNTPLAQAIEGAQMRLAAEGRYILNQLRMPVRIVRVVR